MKKAKHSSALNNLEQSFAEGICSKTDDLKHLVTACAAMRAVPQKGTAIKCYQLSWHSKSSKAQNTANEIRGPKTSTAIH